jgi:colanic acid/amylovoran biosynthesis glycosyltransferase
MLTKAKDDSSARLAYLFSQYPAVNHAFMLREVWQLRRLGAEIHVASVSGPDRSADRLTPEEREEVQSVFYVKSAPKTAVLSAHLRTLFKRPGRYLGGLFAAMRLGRGHIGRTIDFILYFAEAVVLGDWMDGCGCHHLHVHFSSNVAILAAKVFPITISVTFHGPDEFKDPVGFHLREKIGACLFACAISDYGRSQLMNSCDHSQWAKLEVTRLGVDTGKLLPRPLRSHPDPFELLCAGRLAPVKAQHILIRAMEMLVADGRSVRLHLAGDGPDRASLEARVASSGLSQYVVFEGFVNQDEMQRLYERTDVFVLPSFAEGVPVVLMEAMSRGIACVATWVNGVPELIRTGLDGLTVAPGDPGALVQAITRLMDDIEFRRGMEQRARLRAVEFADLTTNVAHLHEVFARYVWRTAAKNEAVDAPAAVPASYSH